MTVAVIVEPDPAVVTEVLGTAVGFEVLGVEHDVAIRIPLASPLMFGMSEPAIATVREFCAGSATGLKEAIVADKR